MSIIDVFFRGRSIVSIKEFPMYFRAHVNQWFYIEEVKSRAKDPYSCPYAAFSDKIGVDYDQVMRLAAGDTNNIPVEVLDHMRCGVSIGLVEVTRHEEDRCLVHLSNAKRNRESE